MAQTPEVLDFDKLLAPISSESPTGAELKEDPSLSATYYAVKDARESARAAERQLQTAWGDAAQMAAVERPDWRKVVALATTTLAENSKDLWIAAWLIEGLTRQHGFVGLRDGFRLVRELSELYWEGIHPLPDDEGVTTTVAQLAGLNGVDSEGVLIGAIRSIPLTPEDSHRQLTLNDYVKAAELQQMADADARQERIDKGAISIADFEAAVRESSPEFYSQLVTEIEEASEELGKLVVTLDEKCGKDDRGHSLAPPASSLQSILEQCLDSVKVIGRVRLAAKLQADSMGDETEHTTADNNATGNATGDAGGGNKGALRTREDAFRELLRLADFFRRTEPHSIVSYSLEQIVRWGQMSLPALLVELIGDDAVRGDMFRRVGIPSDE